MSLPVQRQVVHMTLPVPLQVGQGSPATSPRPPHMPHAKYPEPSQ